MTTSYVEKAEFRLLVAGSSYPLIGIKVTFGSNGINAAQATLAVGRRETSTLSDTFKRVQRGTECEVQYIGAKETAVLVYGLIEDIGPSDVQAGSYGIQVIIVSRLALLSSGTLGSSKLIAKTYRALDMSSMMRSFDTKFIPPEFISPEDSIKKGFHVALRNCLNTIATAKDSAPDSITKLVQQLFGATVNQSASTLIKDIKGSLTFNSIGHDVILGMISSINAFMGANWYNDSFLERLINIGEMLRYRIVEVGDTIRFVPYIPIFNSSLARVISADTYTQLGWDIRSVTPYAGCLLTNGSGDQGEATQNDALVGYFVDPNAEKLGKVLVQPAPSFLLALNVTSIDAPDQAKPMARVSSDNLKKVGANYAKLLTAEANYGERSVSVSFPYIRTDIGPLTPVQVKLPELPGITSVTGSSIYGSVQRVTIVADATREFVSTVYEISHVRSEKQQSVYGSAVHPIWADRWAGISLTGRVY